LFYSKSHLKYYCALVATKVPEKAKKCHTLETKAKKVSHADQFKAVVDNSRAACTKRKSLRFNARPKRKTRKNNCESSSSGSNREKNTETYTI